MGSITNNILLLLFFILFFQSAHPKNASVHPISSNLRCIESERKALLEFKGSLVNASKSLSSWTGRDCCSWHGITCHNLTGHVRTLQLGDRSTQNFSNSSLSPWLFNLTHLEVLRMNNSGFIGSIPNMFDKFTSLIHLDLSWNSFDSAVLPDSLCSLTSLTYMNLTVNNLQGSLPFCLANLTSLTKLDMGSNELSGEIPGALGFLTNLTHLYLDWNNFNSSIPSSFGNLQALKNLYLNHNQLSGAIPSTLGNLTKLVDLDLSYNSLRGELSESVLDGLKSLQYLHMSRNKNLVFNVSPQWIPPFQLSPITMDSVFIGTQFPPWLQTQTNLTYLDMFSVSISGVIPDSFLTANPNLTLIDLSNNFLTGSVPTFDSCASIVYLLLMGNQFSGNIPQKLCNLKSLTYLSLANNQFIGRIPSCLGALQSLYVLDLGNNSLSGHIPYELGFLSNLSILHLNENKFSSKIPESLQNLTHLATLDLGDNKLQGSIPDWIGKDYWSPNLGYLRLESNNFSGEISLNLCQILSLQILNLASNNLVGTIPRCIGNLRTMLSDDEPVQHSINWDHYPDHGGLLNYIKGREMKYTSSLRYAKFISLSGNHLHGEIPIELMNLKGLQSLNLSNNELTGIIPETINNLKHLESLDLSMNRISGSIPQSLASIDALSYLNLSFNNLAGKVPSRNHFNTLNDPSIYQGNMGLCGKLVMKSCPDDDSTTSNQPNGPVPVPAADDEFDQLSWLYAGIGPGFAVGFLAVTCTLYFKHQWRITIFGFADKVWLLLQSRLLTFGVSSTS